MIIKGEQIKVQWCLDISPGPVQSDNGTIRGVGQKAVHLPLHGAFLGTFRFVGLYKKVLYTTM